MIKKFVLFSAALFVIIVAATPVSAQDFFKEGPKASYDKVSAHIQGWMQETDFQKEVEGFQTDLQDFFTFIDQIEWKYPDEAPSEQGEEQPAADSDSSPQPEGQEGSEPTAEVQALDSYTPGEYEQEVVVLVNKERAEEGLPPLEMHDRLSGMADVKSQDMADKNYFSHESPTYGSPFDMMDQFDFSYLAAGENIAAGQRTPEEVVEGWMNSDGHRANILHEDFTHIGVGYVEGQGRYGTYWTQLFMKPR